MRPEKQGFSRLSVIILLMALLTLLCILSGDAEARRKSYESASNLKGISFDEFWSKVTEEGKKWAGDRLYVRSISSGTLRGFDRHEGLSPVWEAQIVKCGDVKEETNGGQHLSVCKGKTITLRMAESGVIGMEPGLHVKKEGKFRGAVVDFDRIKLSAGAAEEAANNHVHYRSGGFDNYTYDLKIDHFSSQPIWIIKKACGPRGVAEMRCRPKDHWIVKLNAETGDIIR